MRPAGRHWQKGEKRVKNEEDFPPLVGMLGG